MKRNLYTRVLVILSFISLSAKAQKNPEPLWPKTPSGNFRCFTDEVHKWRMQQFGTTLSFDAWINRQLEQAATPDAGRIIPIVYNIPVIFHIVHSGETRGTGSNVDSPYVYAQLQQLNNDMRKITGTSGYNDHAFGADVKIQFVAATLDPANVALNEPGINRINKNTFGATNPPFNIAYIENTIKPNSIWDATKYLNVWVLDLNGLLGYAQFPDAPNEPGVGVNNSANTDGVVVQYNTVGSSTKKFPGGYPYDEGRTLTHEVGHWLGLRHIWGDGNCATDDFVFDTPRANGPNFGCPAPIPNSCNDITYGAGADSSDMIKNYMDYTDDACMNIFTGGQMARMRVVMGETGAGAPRRAILRLSDRSTAGPLVSLVLTDTTVLERTSCTIYTAYTIPVRISRAPNATTTVTFTQTSGWLNGQDFTISPASVEFSPTDITDKTFTILVNSDGAMEGHDLGYFNLGVTGSNAVAAADSFELLVMNDDWSPENGKRIAAGLFQEDFEGISTGWITHNYVVGNNQWVIGGTNGNLNGNKSAYISKNNSALEYDPNSTSHSILYREVDATLYDSLSLSFYYVCKGEKSGGINYDFGKVVYSTDSITFHQLNGTTDLVDSTNMTYFSAQIPYFLWNRKFYIGFYWENDYTLGNDPSFAVDDIAISGRRWIPSFIETSVNTTSGFDEKPVGPFETVFFYDKNTGDVIAKIQDLGGYNWGCVKVEIDRAGISGQWVTGDPQYMTQSKLFDKTYRVTPTNNNTNGQYNVTFYLTQNEVNGWQVASGAPLGIARIIKYSGRINDMTYTSTYEQNLATTAAYMGGSDYEITSQFNTGFSGFGFGFIPPGLLPVDIISFSAQEKNKKVDLQWQTANEDNLGYFEVMRSRNGIDFEPLGRVMATGIAGNITDYTLNDPHPFSGKNFYRLHSYDLNGSHKKSKVALVNILSGAAYTVSPNPFADQIMISQSGPVQQQVLVQLADMQGRVIMSRQFNNLIGPATLSTNSLAAGIYLLKITNDEGTQIIKLVKN